MLDLSTMIVICCQDLEICCLAKRLSVILSVQAATAIERTGKSSYHYSFGIILEMSSYENLLSNGP